MPGAGKAMALEELTPAALPETSIANAPNEDVIAVAAYYLWQQRGCPIGSDQEDWFLAEALLKDPKNNSE